MKKRIIQMPPLIGHSGSNKLWIETEKSNFTLIFWQKFKVKFKFKKIVINKHSMQIQFQKFMMQIIFCFLFFKLSFEWEQRYICANIKKKNSKKDFVVASQGVIKEDFKYFNWRWYQAGNTGVPIVTIIKAYNVSD